MNPLTPEVRTEERDANPRRCEECLSPSNPPRAVLWDRPCDGCAAGHVLCGQCARDLGMEETMTPWAWPFCPEAAWVEAELSGRTAALQDAIALRMMARFGGHPRDGYTTRQIEREARAAGLPVAHAVWSKNRRTPSLVMADGRRVDFPLA